MDELPNVITARQLAVVRIRRQARDALQAADAAPYGGVVWVFFRRVAELLDKAAGDVEAVHDAPE